MSTTYISSSNNSSTSSFYTPGLFKKMSKPETFLSKKGKAKLSSTHQNNIKPIPTPSTTLSKLQNFSRSLLNKSTNKLNNKSNNKVNNNNKSTNDISPSSLSSVSTLPTLNHSPYLRKKKKERPLSQYIFSSTLSTSTTLINQSENDLLSPSLTTRPYSTMIDYNIINELNNDLILNNKNQHQRSDSSSSTSSNDSSRSSIKTPTSRQSMIIDNDDLTSIIINEEDVYQYSPNPSWLSNKINNKSNKSPLSIRNKTSLMPTQSLSSPLSSSLPPPLPPIVNINHQPKQNHHLNPTLLNDHKKSSMYPIRPKSTTIHYHYQYENNHLSMKNNNNKKPLSTPSSPILKTCHSSHQNNRNHSLNYKRKSTFESPLLLPSRARSVFGIQDPQQQKEQKVILAWRNSVTHILQQDIVRNIPNKTIKDDIKSLSLRKFIMNEIYTTEKSYYELLLFTKTRYMEPIMKAIQAKDPLVKSSDLPILFTHLSSLINLSETILNIFNHDKPYSNNNINNNASLWKDNPVCIGQLWLNFYEDWTIFLKYAVHYESNTKSIRRACNNVLVLRINQEHSNRKETNRLGISDYLIAPIQRVPRYLLLLKDLLRHTPENNEDYENIYKLVNVMSSLATSMNNTQKIHRRKTS